MRKYLFSCSHDAAFVELYVTSGPLVRIIEATYRDFMSLLETLRSAVFEFPGETWKGSYPERMIKHHAHELGHIRLTASDYRMHLLETYIYLRNSRKDKHQDPSFTRSLLYDLGKSAAQGRAETDSHPTPDPAPAPTRCAHCRRNGTHPGLTKDDCPLKALPKNRAQQALQGLNKSQAKKATRAIASALEDNPSADIEEVIASARAEV